jgi:hypothetical protein
MSASRAALLDELRRCTAELAGEISSAQRVAVLARQARAVRELAMVITPTPRADTAEILKRLERLETQMRDMDAGERARAIITRLGLSRAKYYRLRRRLQSHFASETGERESSPR